MLKLNGYSTLINGAQIINSSSLKTIWKKPLSIKSIKKIYQTGNRYKLETYAANFKKDLKIHSLDQLASESIADIYYKISSKEQGKKIEKELSLLTDISTHIIPSKAGVYLVFTDIQASKAHAITHVAKLLKIKPSKIIGVGDGYNDFPLLMACGLKIAMGNAVAELKAIADFVAPSVDEDGVATIIEKFILEENS